VGSGAAGDCVAFRRKDTSCAVAPAQTISRNVEDMLSRRRVSGRIAPVGKTRIDYRGVAGPDIARPREREHRQETTKPKPSEIAKGGQLSTVPPPKPVPSPKPSSGTSSASEPRASPKATLRHQSGLSIHHLKALE